MNQPLIHSLLADPLDGAAIEARSLAAIDQEAPPHCYPLREWAVVRRMIHATADFSLAGCTHFSPGQREVGCGMDHTPDYGPFA